MFQLAARLVSLSMLTWSHPGAAGFVNSPDTSHSPPLLENSMALTQPKCPSMSFLYRLVQPASLRLWNSSLMKGSPVSSLRDRKPTEERIPQPFSSFIFSVLKQKKAAPPSFFHRSSLHICSCASVNAAPARRGLHAAEPTADVDVVIVVSLLSLVGSPSSSFLLQRRISLPPPVCHAASPAGTPWPLLTTTGDWGNTRVRVFLPCTNTKVFPTS